MGIFELAIHSRGFWFRVLEHGASARYGAPLFSERNGFRKTFRVGNFMIERLTP